MISKRDLPAEPMAEIRARLKGRESSAIRSIESEWALAFGLHVYEDESIAVVADADIYNARELDSDDSGRCPNEAALLGRLYRKHGTGLFGLIKGPFAVCILDRKRMMLYVATDPFGIRPVVYCGDNHALSFGQRIKDLSLFSDPAHAGIDDEALVDYLNLAAIPTPKTIYRSVKKLPPGHYLVASADQVSPDIRRYYDIQYGNDGNDEEYFMRQVPLSIEDAVRRIVEHEKVWGRNIGAFLSGGTDSSTVTGMIQKTCGHVKTFSIGFDEPGYNELEYARLAARHYGSEHREYIVSPDDVLHALDVVIHAFDEPFANASAIPTYYCARLAREEGVDSLIAGDGGDEIFGGNERYAANHVFEMYHRIPAFLRSGFIQPLLDGAPAFLPLVSRGRKYVRRALIPQPDRSLSYAPVSALGMDYIFSPGFLDGLNGYDNLQWARELYDSALADNDLDRLLYIDMKFAITDNDLRKVNTMSAKAGVKVNYPLLDYDLVNLAATMPPHMKVRGRSLRYIFKKSLADFLPADVIKKEKHGFGLPIGLWIRTEERISSFVRDHLLSPSCSLRPYLREGFMDEIFALHREGRSNFYGDIIYRLLILELWNRKKAVPVMSGVSDEK